MYIRTFIGCQTNIQKATDAAEHEAESLLTSLSKSELVSVQAQTLIEQDEVGVTYFHVITVVFE